MVGQASCALHIEPLPRLVRGGGSRAVVGLPPVPEGHPEGRWIWVVPSPASGPPARAAVGPHDLSAGPQSDAAMDRRPSNVEVPKKTLSVAHLVAAQWLKWVDASGIPQPYTFGFTTYKYAPSRFGASDVGHPSTCEAHGAQ